MGDEAMGKMAYFDCPTGIAGDMCLGAMVHAGLPLEVLRAGLAPLGLATEYALGVQTVQRCGQAATRLEVQLLSESGHHHRHLPEIEALIHQAGFSARVTDWSLAIFRRLAVAEAAVHGIAPEQVHFHEVGATDALVDIIGTCLGLEWFGIERVYCSALPTGGGTVRAAHGRLPVPVPAVLQLLTMAQVPIYSNGIEKELVTPTGCAIATTLVQSFGPPPPMTLQQVGLGAGGQELPLPNILRLWIGTTAPVSPQTSSSQHPPHSSARQDHAHLAPSVGQSLAALTVSADPVAAAVTQPETIVELQTQLDDLTPQAIGYLFDKLFEAGAVDVFTQAVGMKKNRPGVLITVLCPPPAAETCEQLLFAETTTLGVRRTLQQRQTLLREWITLDLPYGSVRIKVARHQPQGQIINVQPEYEDCAHLARTQGLPWKQVYQHALALAHQLDIADGYHP
jgi:uncharacterized protein (TIGR00299 family) protein